MLVDAFSTTLYTVSQATMGLNASRVLAIDLLKRLHRGGEVALTENDCFDENGNFDDEMFQEYLVQEDGDEALMRKARIALSYMVGQSNKRKREALLESERAFKSAKKKFISFLRDPTYPKSKEIPFTVHVNIQSSL